MQAGGMALLSALLQHSASARLGCFMAAQAVENADLRTAELICHRLADHAHFIPSWLGNFRELAAALPVEDSLATHAHPSAKFGHLLHLVQGLGSLLSGATHDGLMLHIELLSISHARALRKRKCRCSESTANATFCTVSASTWTSVNHNQIKLCMRGRAGQALHGIAAVTIVL